MATRQMTISHGWSVDVQSLLDQVSAGECDIDPTNAISALPGIQEAQEENPHRRGVEIAVERLCCSIGLRNMDRMHASFRLGRLTALCFPQASREQLYICNMVLIFAFAFDDALDVSGANGNDADHLAEAVKNAIAGRAGDAHQRHPLVRLAQEIYNSLQKVEPDDAWVNRFYNTFDDFVNMAIKARQRWLDGESTTDLSTYLHERYYDVGVCVVLTLVELTRGHAIDTCTFNHPSMSALRSACTFNITFVNDVFSYHKEVILNGNMTNAIAVVQMQYQVSFARAVAVVVLMARRCFEEFEVRARLFLEDPGVSEGDKRYIRSMRTWMVGSLQWANESRRYRHPESPFPELREGGGNKQTQSMSKSGKGRSRQQASASGGDNSSHYDDEEINSEVVPVSAAVTSRRTATI